MRYMNTLLRVLTIVLCLVANASAQDVVTYFHPDASGSPTVATDEYGNVLWREVYAPYGERLRQELSPRTNRLWFTRHHQDEDSGLIYAGARHYDPVVARFLSVDPAPVRTEDSFSVNRYAYANANPYSFVDPDGRESREFNWENQHIYKAAPPPRSDKDWLGPAIGGGLSAMALPVAAVGGYELGLLALANPASASAWTVAVADAAAGGAVVGNAQVPVSATLKIIEETEDVLHFTATTSRGTVEGVAGLVVKGETWIFQRLHVQPVDSDRLRIGREGINEIQRALAELGKSRGFKKMIIEGGERSQGKMKGRIPTPKEIPLE